VSTEITRIQAQASAFATGWSPVWTMTLARIVAHAARWPAGRVERQLHREALRRCQPSATVLVRIRQAGRRICIVLGDAPADTIDPRAGSTLAGQHVEHHLSLKPTTLFGEVFQSVPFVPSSFSIPCKPPPWGSTERTGHEQGHSNR
jgi:hypothetical protein